MTDDPVAAVFKGREAEIINAARRGELCLGSLSRVNPNGTCWKCGVHVRVSRRGHAFRHAPPDAKSRNASTVGSGSRKT